MPLGYTLLNSCWRSSAYIDACLFHSTVNSFSVSSPPLGKALDHLLTGLVLHNIIPQSIFPHLANLRLQWELQKTHRHSSGGIVAFLFQSDLYTAPLSEIPHSSTGNACHDPHPCSSAWIGTPLLDSTLQTPIVGDHLFVWGLLNRCWHSLLELWCYCLSFWPLPTPSVYSSFLHITPHLALLFSSWLLLYFIQNISYCLSNLHLD